MSNLLRARIRRHKREYSFLTPSTYRQVRLGRSSLSSPTIITVSPLSRRSLMNYPARRRGEGWGVAGPPKEMVRADARGEGAKRTSFFVLSSSLIYSAT